MKPIHLLFAFFNPKYLPLLLLVSLHCVGSETIANRATVIKAIDGALQPYAQNQVFLGHVLVALNGEVLYQRSITPAHDPSVDKVSENTRFPIASLSKPMVATLALMLSERGQLDLQQTLDQALPNFGATWAAEVTLDHLLTNRSGLPNHFVLSDWASGRYRDISQADFLQTLTQIELSFTPGSQYQYTNLGWYLLARAIEAATAKPFSQNLEELLFAPLAMRQSGLIDSNTSGLTKGYRWGEKGGWQTHPTLTGTAFEGGAGVYASAEDMARFLHALHQNPILSDASKQVLFSRDKPYAWRIDDLPMAAGKVKTLHSYDGQLEGHSSLWYHYVEDDLSIVLLANNGIGFTHKQALADDISAAMFELPINPKAGEPSFALHKALATGNWRAIIEQLTKQPLTSQTSGAFVLDLAQQLEWSGNTAKAIDLYAWLSLSFANRDSPLKALKRLCQQMSEHPKCASESPVAVGMTVLPLVDKQRKAWRSDNPRPLTTHIFYPTRVAQAQPFYLGPPGARMFFAGAVAKGAKPDSGQRPLVLMSHGTGGSAPQMLWLAEALVKQGYMVAAVNHHGNTAIEGEKYPEGYLLWWERSRDLQVVFQQLTSDPAWRTRIDKDRVAVVGFSLGGYTALSALGGITDKALFDQFCQQTEQDFSCKPQPEFLSVLEAFEQVIDSPQVQEINARQQDSYRVPGLKAAVVIAPAVVHAFKPESLASITTPTLLLVGDKDQIAPRRANADYAHSLLANSKLEALPGAHHYSFLSECTAIGVERLPRLCESPYGIDRNEVHRQAIAAALEFLAEQL